MNLNAPELALALLCVIGTAWTAYGVYALVSVWQEVRTDLRQELGAHFGLARFVVLCFRLGGRRQRAEKLFSKIFRN